MDRLVAAAEAHELAASSPSSFDSKVASVDAFSRRGQRLCIEETLQGGCTMTCTPDHLIKRTKGWIQAKDLVLAGSHSSHGHHPRQHHRVACMWTREAIEWSHTWENNIDSIFSFSLSERKHKYEWILTNDREPILALAIARLQPDIWHHLTQYSTTQSTADDIGISAAGLNSVQLFKQDAPWKLGAPLGSYEGE